MTLGGDTENDILKLYMNASAIANIADNAATSPLTNLAVGLYTATVSDATGTSQATSEATYTGYSTPGRVNVARTTSGWTAATAGVSSNVAAVTFGACTAGTNTITDVAVGTAQTGAGKVIVSGALTASLAVSAGITPSFAIGALTFTLE